MRQKLFSLSDKKNTIRNRFRYKFIGKEIHTKLAKLPPPSLKKFNNKMYKCLTIELDILTIAVNMEISTEPTMAVVLEESMILN
jgi:hypothetical protein